MKIGLATQFFDFRNDIRHIIHELSKKCTVVVFGKNSDREKIIEKLPDGIEFRVIDERSNSIKNKFSEYRFLLFKSLPQSRNNYFLTEQFKISNYNLSSSKKILAKAILNFQKTFKGKFTYDQYLENLQYKSGTPIEDIDIFLLCTEVIDDYFLKRLMDEKNKLFIYVYSWDHACKNPKFSRKLNYLTWHKEISNDVAELQQVPRGQITECGATQLGFLEMFRSQPEITLPQKQFIYFGCAIGINEIVNEEVGVIKLVADRLKAVKPNWKLVVRPYPVLRNWNYYKTLNDVENIVFDKFQMGSDLSLSESDILAKYRLIENASGFFHLGTTLGLECCYLNTPSFIVDFGYDKSKNINLHGFIHQYQNEKYLIAPFPSNHIRSVAQLDHILKNIDDPVYMMPNRKVPEYIEPNSFESFTDNLISIITNPVFAS